MNIEVLLDRHGDLPVPPGYQVIASEVEFLRYATDDLPLLIRGENLCAWAETFYALRGRPCRHQESLSAVLQHTFPALSEAQSGQLAQEIGLASVSVDQISAVFVLNKCYPTDFSLWQGHPSLSHAASWLLWMYSHSPNEAERIILQSLALSFEMKARSTSVERAYQVMNKDQAKTSIYIWLGLLDGGQEKVSVEFPLTLPDPLLNEIKFAWNLLLVETQGLYFEQMLKFPLSIFLRQELAYLAAQYYLTNNEHLTREMLQRLQPYLLSQEITALEKHLAIPEPDALPEQESQVLHWFQFQYLPYRRWQARYGKDEARARVRHHAHVFAKWYLENYPRWVLQSKWISFQQTAQLRNNTNAVTFCVILDGLPAWDAEDFARTVSGKIERLQLRQKDYCFTSLPTVTEFAKDALLKGVPPQLAPNYQALGKILPDKASPSQGLKNAQPGELIFWRVSQPDEAYHFEADAKRERQVRAELDSIIQALSEVVETLPQSIPLQVIVTTDHGRLLNPKSSRRLPVPDGMQVHGRVAWGSFSHAFDESGFIIDEDAGWIIVHGERFEMKPNLLIALGEDTFSSDNEKTRTDPYPHGGLFPEEAIIPWFVFERDAQQPNLQIKVSGKGEAESTGSLNISVNNASRIMVECLSITLSNNAQVKGSWQIAPLSQTEFNTQIAHWPTKADLPTVSLLFRQPNGVTFTIEIAAALEVNSLYDSKNDSLLKDLEL